MKVCVVPVDYGKPALTRQLVASLAAQCAPDVTVELLVVENSGRVAAAEYRFLESLSSSVRGRVLFQENRGYFGSAAQAIADHAPADADWVIVCNNDLRFDADFMARLHDRTPQLRDRLLLCPNVLENGRPANPLSRSPYPALKARFWDYYYSHPGFARRYESVRLRISHAKHALRGKMQAAGAAEGEIYLGYGAMFVINPDFLRRCGGLPSETFLYQEESVICGHVRRLGGQPYYLPELIVYHDSHATLSSLSFDRDYALRREAWWKTRHHLVPQGVR